MPNAIPNAHCMNEIIKRKRNSPAVDNLMLDNYATEILCFTRNSMNWFQTLGVWFVQYFDRNCIKQVSTIAPYKAVLN